jgi:TPR repeat protein
MSYEISDKCTSCGKCKENCFFNAISSDSGKYSIVESECVDCGICFEYCPSNAIISNNNGTYSPSSKSNEEILKNSFILVPNNNSDAEKLAHYEKLIEEANMHYMNGDYKSAYRIVNNLAKKKYPRGINFLGILHMEGKYVKKDLSKAIKLFTEAGELGEPRGLKNLAELYATGTGVKVDLNKAKQYILKCANTPGSYGKYIYGWALQHGAYGFNENRTEAINQYEQALDNEYAMYNLALLLLYEKGTDTDNQRAIKLIEEAASKGVTDATKLLTTYSETLSKVKSVSECKHTFVVSDVDFRNFRNDTDIEKAAYLMTFGNTENYTVQNLAVYAFFLSSLQYLYYEAPSDEKNLFMISELIESAVERTEGFRSELDGLFSLLEERNQDHIALKNYHEYKTLSDIYVQDVVTLCRSKLSFIYKDDNFFKFANKRNANKEVSDFSLAFCIAFSPSGSDYKYLSRRLNRYILNDATNKIKSGKAFTLNNLKSSIENDRELTATVQAAFHFYREFM